MCIHVFTIRISIRWYRVLVSKFTLSLKRYIISIIEICPLLQDVQRTLKKLKTVIYFSIYFKLGNFEATLYFVTKP